MARTSRVPYHQNVYDLLGIEPDVCPDAARMITEHEAAHGSLPASVKEWYLVPNVVPLRSFESGTIWDNYRDPEEGLPQASTHTSLEELLRNVAHIGSRTARGWVSVIWADACWWFADWLIELNGSDDPPVHCTHNTSGSGGTEMYAATFSDFTSGWFARSYATQWESVSNSRSTAEPHANGLWLRAPGSPFVPAAIDYLTEQLHDPERTPRPGDVTTYAFRPSHGTIRVTADSPDHGGALAAWWVHAETPERLAEFARLIAPFTQLQADTDPAREVLKAVLGERGASAP